MQFNTIQDVRDHQFVGNHAGDFEAFNAIDQFARDTSKPVAERAEALNIMLKDGMGIEPDQGQTPEQIVNEYLAS